MFKAPGSHWCLLQELHVASTWSFPAVTKSLVQHQHSTVCGQFVFSTKYQQRGNWEEDEDVYCRKEQLHKIFHHRE